MNESKLAELSSIFEKNVARAIESVIPSLSRAIGQSMADSLRHIFREEP